MKLLWFLTGLAIGLVPLVWYQVRLRLQLKQITQSLDMGNWRTPFSIPSQLLRTVANYRQVNQDLERQSETWKQIVKCAPVGYLQVDEDNQLTLCNSQACQLLSISNYNSLQPRLLLELVRSYELDLLIEQARETEKPCHREWMFYPTSVDAVNLSDQRTTPLRGHAFPLAGDNVGVFLENRQEALTLVQQRDRWASDVAHELKTPLTSIRLVAETLQSRLEPPTRHWVDRLLTEAIRLSTLVQELLDLSQLEVNPVQRLNVKPIDLVKLIHTAWLGLEPLASEKGVVLGYEGPKHLLIKADEPRLHRVLLNLFDNGIKYSPLQTFIRVGVSLQSHSSPQQGQPFQFIQIDIIDAGQGFPETALPYVFERFYRADPSRSRHPDPQRDLASATQPIQLSSGSGLGLAIVRQIIEAHQGSVSASNDPSTGGAWLQIQLPYSEVGDLSKEA